MKNISEFEKENILLLSQLQEMCGYMDLMAKEYEKRLDDSPKNQVKSSCNRVSNSQDLDKELEAKSKELDSLRFTSEKALRLNNVAARYISNIFSNSLALKRLIKRQKAAINASGFFDEEWYREKYLSQDIGKSPQNPKSQEKGCKGGLIEGMRDTAKVNAVKQSELSAGKTRRH